METPLAGVNRTLLMPLWGRAKATRAGSRILSDPAAVAVVERLDLDLRDLDRTLHPSNELFTIARARALDDIARGFLSRHAAATVINLGAGLDTAFHRVDDGRAAWFDVDLPAVIDLRQRLIPPTERTRRVAGSILEPGWVREVTPRPAAVLCLASGLLAYFRACHIRKLLAILAAAFPGGELAFDVQSPATNLFGNRRLRASGMGEARFRWGAFSAAAVLRLCPQLEILESFAIFAKLARDDFASERDWRMARSMDRMRAMWLVHARLPRQPGSSPGDDGAADHRHVVPRAEDALDQPMDPGSQRSGSRRTRFRSAPA